MEIDNISGLILYLGYWLVYESMIGTFKNLTLYAKRPFISGPYKRALVYVTEQCALTEISDLGKTVTISLTHGT